MHVRSIDCHELPTPDSRPLSVIVGRDDDGGGDGKLVLVAGKSAAF